MKFVDVAKIIIKSGDGGAGHSSFRHEKYVPKGGPDGGNGGKGGDVIFIADPQLSTLLDFKYRRNHSAENGKPGGTARKSGKDGKSVYIKVPVGTVIKNVETGEILADLETPGLNITLAEGGIGGKGNSEFCTPTNQAPRYAQPGMPGIETEIELELKLIADVGIVGFPNAGKSTLISVISDAKPKIADYPFTTLIPNLGIVKIANSKSFVVADIPGLIEGAGDGKGLGYQFLRHIERSRALLFLIECFSEDPVTDYKKLLGELTRYNPEMQQKRKIICLSKADAIDPGFYEEIANLYFGEHGRDILIISSVSGTGIETLKNKLWEIVSSEKTDI